MHQGLEQPLFDASPCCHGCTTFKPSSSSSLLFLSSFSCPTTPLAICLQKDSATCALHVQDWRKDMNFFYNGHQWIFCHAIYFRSSFTISPRYPIHRAGWRSGRTIMRMVATYRWAVRQLSFQQEPRDGGGGGEEKSLTYGICSFLCLSQFWARSVFFCIG